MVSWLAGGAGTASPAGMEITRILATDCGRTTTKAIRIEKRDGEYRLIRRGEAPTTVEAPAEDVTKGVLNAVGEIEDLEGRKLLNDSADGVNISQDGVGGVGLILYPQSDGIQFGMLDQNREWILIPSSLVDYKESEPFTTLTKKMDFSKAKMANNRTASSSSSRRSTNCHPSQSAHPRPWV